MTISPTRPIRRKELPALTGLRFFAAFQVVLFHYGAGFARRHHFPVLISRLLGNGWVAVSLFFLLSGFILSYTYSGQIKDASRRRHFWEARFARLYPVYLLSLLLMVPFAFFGAYPQGVRSPWQALSVIGMLQSWNPLRPATAQIWNSPAWTLSVEAFFYLLFPFLLPRLEKCSLRALRGAILCLLVLIAGTHSMDFGDPALALTGIAPYIPLPVARLPEFILGAVLGLHFLRSAAPPRSAFLVALSLLSIAVLESTVSGPWISLLVFPFVTLLYLLAGGGDQLSKFLSSNFLVLLGGASYSIYLLQVPVRLWTDRFLSRFHLTDAVVASSSLMMLVFVSILVYLYWEEPARRRIRVLFSGDRPPRKVPPTGPLSQTENS